MYKKYYLFNAIYQVNYDTVNSRQQIFPYTEFIASKNLFLYFIDKLIKCIVLINKLKG